MNRVRSIVHAEAAYQKNIRGKGIGIAIVDTGLSLHPDYKKRITGWYDTLSHRQSPYDDCGHGSHVAGIAAGDGNMSHGRFMGIAPEASLIGVKVLDRKGNGHIPEIMQGLDWIWENHERQNIRIVNISIGANDFETFHEGCAFVQKVDHLWDSGIVVVAAAGNKGPGRYTISAPGNSRRIITAGSTLTRKKRQKNRPFRNESPGRGPTKNCIKKPDVVAPGFRIISCAAYDSFADSIQYQEKSGTSMSAPVVSGAIALLLCRFPDMTPRDVKIRLRGSCTDLHQPHDSQGWGLLNIRNLLDL